MSARTAERPSDLAHRIDTAAAEVEPRVIAWRRDLHQHPELGNRETRTAAIVAEHLRSLGFDDVRTGVAHTGVVGLLKGKLPGRVVALRADMDALPVTEEVDVPFVSKARAIWNGESVGVMHACGHDCHTAILLGVATVLAGLREHLRGSIKFIFQPAEEMPPRGEDGGAKMMIQEGALQDPAPQAIFGLHVTSRQNVGFLGYRAGPTMASSDRFSITVHGRQTHGAAPWLGVDPIVTSAQVVLGLQTVVSRGIDISREPAVVTVGMIRGGVRENIIPDSVEMRGTIRTFDEGMRDDVHERVTTLAEAVARGSRAGCTVCIEKNYPGHRQRPGADRGDAADAAARGRGRQGAIHPQGHRLRGLLVLPAAGARALLLRRRHATRCRPCQGGAQPFAAIPGRRTRVAARRAIARPPGVRLSRDATVNCASVGPRQRPHAAHG